MRLHVQELTFAAIALTATLLSGPVACAAKPSPASAAVAPAMVPPALNQPADSFDALALQSRFEQVARDCAPSVVAISATPHHVSSIQPVDAPQLASALDRVSRMVGTGFIVDADGHILTNHHVIADAAEIWVTTDDRKVYPARLIGFDARNDLAVLKISARGLRPVRFAPPASVLRGQWALTLGNPYGLATGEELALSVGVISATSRSLPRLSARENRSYSDLIQTTAQINPGNSGGPLFDLEGRVIGVNAAVSLPQKNTNGIGFAFPITEALLQRVEQLKATPIALK